MAFQSLQLAEALSGAVEKAMAEHGLASCSHVLADPRVAVPFADKLAKDIEPIDYVSINSQVALHVPGAFASTAGLATPVEFVPVPTDSGAVRGALAAAIFNALLGLETVSYGAENDGHPFVNLVPQPGKGRSARKSHDGMRGHTDGVSFPFPGTRDEAFYRMAPAPDWVCLVCLRNPNGVPTRVVPVEPFLKELSPELIAALRSPQFIIGAQGTFAKGMTAILGLRHIVDGGALLSDGPEFAFRFSHSTVDIAPDATEHASTVLEMVQEYCAASSQAIILNPGDLLWVNNRRAIHGRGEVGGAAGGQERWLLRTYGILSRLLEPEQRYVERPFQLYP